MLTATNKTATICRIHWGVHVAFIDNLGALKIATGWKRCEQLTVYLLKRDVHFSIQILIRRTELLPQGADYCEIFPIIEV